MLIAIKIALMLTLIYLFAGLVFAVFFLGTKGIEKVDAAAHGSGFGFRLIIFPGTVALWPVLLKKWINVKKISHDQTAA